MIVTSDIPPLPEPRRGDIKSKSATSNKFAFDLLLTYFYNRDLIKNHSETPQFSDRKQIHPNLFLRSESKDDLTLSHFPQIQLLKQFYYAYKKAP